MTTDARSILQQRKFQTADSVRVPTLYGSGGSATKEAEGVAWMSVKYFETFLSLETQCLTEPTLWDKKFKSINFCA